MINEKSEVSAIPAHAEGPQPGVYRAYFPPSPFFYEGSTANLYHRVKDHESKLRKGSHKSPAVQKAYDEAGRVVFEVQRTTNRQAAFEEEQRRLDASHGNPFCLNTSPDARKTVLSSDPSALRTYSPRGPHSPEHIAKIKEAAQNRPPISEETRRRLSESHKGATLSEEHKEKIRLTAQGSGLAVNIEGVNYSSVKDAARQLKMDPGTLRSRVFSNNEKFKDWMLAE